MVAAPRRHVHTHVHPATWSRSAEGLGAMGALACCARDVDPGGIGRPRGPPGKVPTPVVSARWHVSRSNLSRAALSTCTPS